MVWKRLARAGLPALFALLVVAGIAYHARLSQAQSPSVRSGALDLARWNGEQAFEIAGEWEFYWDELLSGRQIRGGGPVPALVEAPDKWNNYRMDGANLPGKGQATYRVRVTGAQPGAQYGVRVQGMASAYRLYADDTLVAQNGRFGDTETAPASAYRPQLASFTPAGGSFDLVLQVSNEIDGIGGMWEPIVFGAYRQVAAFDRLFSNAAASVMTGLVVAFLIFLIFFAAHRGEKDALILPILGIFILLRLTITGDVALSQAFPNLPVAWLSRIDFLSVCWAQFFLLAFIYCNYEGFVLRWQVAALAAYTAAVSLFILLFPLAAVTSSYRLMNAVLLLVMVAVTAQLTRAAWRGLEGAALLLGAVWLILLMIFYNLFLPDRSPGYYLLQNLHVEYMVFVFAQACVVALRYRRAQMLEIAHLKGQIRPHFIHNALTTIISVSRAEPDRARELLVDFSSYLRGFYEYDRNELVPFSQELELVRAYVSLERARFGDRLRAEYRVDAADFLLPPLILQPLVENAFVHGLREKDGGGTAVIYASRVKNGRVRVGVRDDGVGLFVKPGARRRGVGIENINRRLSRLYRTALVYLAPEGGGCEVYFEIPCREAAKHEGVAD